MKILNLTLKKKWFDMILSGEKKEEYREIKPYWLKRFLIFSDKGNEKDASVHTLMCMEFKNFSDYCETLVYFFSDFKEYDAIKFTNGYAKYSPSFLIEFKGFDVREGKIKWGATDDIRYFVLKLGKVL